MTVPGATVETPPVVAPAAAAPVVTPEPAAAAVVPPVVDPAAVVALDGSVTPPVAAAVAPAKPEGVSDAIWDAEKGTFKADEVAKLSTTAEAYAKLTEGAVDDPSKVDFAGMMAGLKDTEGNPLLGPDGKAIEPDADSPLLKAAAEIFASNKVGAALQTQLTAAFIQSQIDSAKAVAAAGAAEFAKLGENGPARTEVLKNFLKSEGGDEALVLFSRLGTASEFEFLEKLMGRVTGPAAGAGSAGSPAPEKDMAGRMFPDARRSAKS